MYSATLVSASFVDSCCQTERAVSRSEEATLESLQGGGRTRSVFDADYIHLEHRACRGTRRQAGRAHVLYAFIRVHINKRPKHRMGITACSLVRVYPSRLGRFDSSTIVSLSLGVLIRPLLRCILRPFFFFFFPLISHYVPGQNNDAQCGCCSSHAATNSENSAVVPR